MTRPIVAVFGSSTTAPGTGPWAEAERCGRLLAEAGCDVATGGYGGVMEAVSAGAVQAGGAALGMTAPTVFPGRTGANEYVTEERPAPTLVSRIEALVTDSAAAIALPGSIGTAAELIVAWNLAYVSRYAVESSPQPVVTVGPTWRTIVESLTGTLDTDGGLVTCVEDVDAAVAAVLERI